MSSRSIWSIILEPLDGLDDIFLDEMQESKFTRREALKKAKDIVKKEPSTKVVVKRNDGIKEKTIFKHEPEVVVEKVEESKADIIEENNDLVVNVSLSVENHIYIHSDRHQNSLKMLKRGRSGVMSSDLEFDAKKSTTMAIESDDHIAEILKHLNKTKGYANIRQCPSEIFDLCKSATQAINKLQKSPK